MQAAFLDQVRLPEANAFVINLLVCEPSSASVVKSEGELQCSACLIATHIMQYY